MKIRVKIIIAVTLVLTSVPAFALDPPAISLSISDTFLSLQWTSPPGSVTGYILCYTPFPYTEGQNIVNVDMKTATHFSVDLWYGAAYYVAVKAYNESDTSEYSEIKLFTIEKTAPNAECSDSNLDLCEISNDCLRAGGYWYNALCNEVPPAGESLALRVYVAGESVEEFNHMDSKPFADDGTLNGPSNTATEYGWMVPFAERLHIRDPNLAVQWTGSGCWLNQDSWECSTGAYTSQEIGQTSAEAGSTIQAWQAAHNAELATKQFCYDIAFASRGGNDLEQQVSSSTYEAQLRQLVLDLDAGSNCRAHPIIYVTGHLLDSATWNYGVTRDDIDLWMSNQKAYYVDISRRVAEELNTDGRHVRFIDMWTPFHDDLITTAFPSETWWTVNANSVRMPDLDKLHRDSSQHPGRLASLFAGENVANQINIAEIWSLIGK